MKMKKTAATVGTVLHMIKQAEALKPWAEYLSGEEPWKRLNVTADTLLGRWGNPGQGWQFFSAADPKNAKTPGFEHEHGFIAFSTSVSKDQVSSFMNGPAPDGIEGCGYVGALGAKVRHKGIGKYLLSAAERVISEKNKKVFLFVSQSNASAQRFYKSQGYEEVSRHNDCIIPGNVEILLMKTLNAD